jgi:uncharacterized membrane protein
MNRYMTAGLTMLAGAALLEAALIPGLVIGGAAVLAPAYLPKLRRRLKPLLDAAVPGRSASAAAPNRPSGKARLAVPARLGIGRAVAKTITFRIIVTTLDFTTNYVVIGELATAAGLSAFNLVAGPLFYLGHEAAWNYFGPAEGAVDVSAVLPLQSGAITPSSGRGGVMISRALAKTITFRTIATVVDFTTNYVVVGDIVTAAGLSAFAFVVGPFVYLGHEKFWDYYGSPRVAAADVSAPKSLVTA